MSVVQLAARLTHMGDHMWLAYGVPLLADGITTLILMEGNYLLMCFSLTFNHSQSLLPGGCWFNFASPDLRSVPGQE